MKVFFITISRKGICHYTSQLANALSGYCDVTMISPVGTAEYIDPPAKVIEIDYPATRRDPRYYLKLAQVISIIHRDKPDIVHIQDLHPVLCLIAMFRGNAKFIQTLHDVNAHMGEELFYSKITRNYAVNKSEALVVHGDNLRDTFVKIFPGAASKVYVTNMGSWSMFRKWMSPDIVEEKNILLFGRIRKYKGIEILLQAAPKIHEALPDFTFTIAGEGDISDYLPLLENCSDYVRINNTLVPDEEIPELFQKSCIVVLPYLDGSQSGILPMAYEFNKPVIVTSVGSIHESVDDGRTGLIIPPGDVDALAESVIKLAKDPELREQMKAAIKQKVDEEISWSAAAKRTLAVYEEILSGGGVKETRA